jgi:hypothetical protein
MVPLIDRGGAVNHKGEGLISGDAKGEGVGAHARLDTKGGCDGWTGVGPGESDASLLGGHCGVVSCDAILETVEVRSRSAERGGRGGKTWVEFCATTKPTPNSFAFAIARFILVVPMIHV